VHDYSKQFNHLAQYAPDQVDTDDKKKDRFMISLSTKLHDIFRVCEQCHDHGRCHLRPQGNQEEEGCGCTIRQCSPEVPDGVPSQLHLSTLTAAPASASVAAMGSPRTSALAPAGRT
jgi:hypothetical protein